MIGGAGSSPDRIEFIMSMPDWRPTAAAVASGSDHSYVRERGDVTCSASRRWLSLSRRCSLPHMALGSMTDVPEALNWSAENCTLGRAMEILGEKWTFVVLREVFLGIRRFDDLRVRTGIPRQVLTNRLAMLVDRGLLRRHPYQVPGARSRDEYRLTQMGLDLYPALAALLTWGDRYLGDPDGSALALVHRECGAEVHSGLSCSDGHTISPREVGTRPGPGARRRT
jgi:DNA-binding HxlR family transcriptional regulator